MRRIEKLSAWLLLWVFVPMVVLSSVHVHHETIDAHDDCRQCAGHIEEAHHHDHDCLYCDFLGQSYLVQDEGQQVALFPAAECISVPTQSVVKQLHHGVAQLRAPPTA